MAGLTERVMNDENIVVETEELSPQPEAKQAPEMEKPAEPELPKKFQGKSMHDVIDMYSQLESEYGRRGNEVGQLRRLTDELLGLHKAKELAEAAKSTPVKKITSDDLFTDPDATITEKVRQAAEERASITDQRVRQMENYMLEEAFERKHNGFRQTMQTEEFLNFVKASPYRVGLVQKAAKDDWTAADELFTAYSEYKALAPTKQEADHATQADRVGLVKSGGSSASGVVGRNDGKKVYSRTDLINMRIRNPDEFDARYEKEFLPAYLEGRVR